MKNTKAEAKQTNKHKAIVDSLSREAGQGLRALGLAPRRRAFAVLFALLFASQFAAALAQEQPPPDAQIIEGLKLPLKRHANGKVQAFLTASRAWMTAAGITAEGDLRVYLFAEDGSTNGVARAAKGIFDNNSSTLYCPGSVVMEKESVRIAGENLLWESDKNRATIQTNAVLVIDRGGKSLID